MDGRLSGKRALVIGGGTGIGLACAEAMIADGAGLFLSGRRKNPLQEAAAKLGGAGKVGYATGDATISADVARVTAAAVDYLGGLDTLVISAGAGGRTILGDAEPEHVQHILDHNLRPVFLTVQHALPHLLAAGKASILVISSTFGLVGVRERFAYCAAKAGVNGMVRSMALDLAEHGVRINAICPGFIETPMSHAVAAVEPDPAAALAAKRLMHPIPRAGRLDEVGALGVYLASDPAAFVTGQAIAIDGGYAVR